MRNFNLLKAFLSALQTQIINNNIFDSNCVQLSLEDDITQIPQGTPALSIKALAFNTLGWDTGGGASDLAIRGNIRFKIMVLNTLDVPYSDQSVISSTDTTLGVYELVDKLIELLEMLDICDENGNTYCVEPMRFRSMDDAKRHKEFKDWVYIDVLFEVTICQNTTNVS